MRPLWPLAICLIASGCRAPESAATGEQNAPTAKPGNTERNSGQLVVTAEAQRAMTIVIEPARSRAAAEVITANGQLVLNEDKTWHVGALSNGRVDEVLANVGDTVRQGQVLARMHSHEVHEVRASYRQAEAELDRARAAELYAKRLRDRAVRLLAIKAASPQELEAAETDLRAAQSAVLKSQSELEKERVHITEFLRLPIEDKGHEGETPIHRHDEDDIPVASQAAGLVIQRKVSLGTVVAPGTEIFTITDPASLWMIAAVNEADLSRVHIGQRARILVKAYPGRAFPGRILKLGEAMDPVTRTLQVRVLVPNGQVLLKPEMYATAGNRAGELAAGRLRPEGAAQELNGQQIVFVRTSETQFVPRSIQVARTVNGEIEIANGLNAGEQVAVKGGFVLKSLLLKSSLQEE